MLRRGLRRLAREIDDESTNIYQWMLYTVLCASGLTLILLTSAPATSLRHSLVGLQYDGWRAILTLAPMMCMVGRMLEHKRRAAYYGIAWQLLGNIGIAGVLAVYAVGAFETWKLAAFGGFMAIILVIATTGLSVRALRRLIKVERSL